MKNVRWKIVFFAVVFVLFAFHVVAQTRPVKRRTGGSSYGNSNTQQRKQPEPDTTGTGYGAPANNNPSSVYGNTAPAQSSFDTTLPVKVIAASGNGLLDTVKMSLRMDGAIEKNLIKERTPLSYDYIREDDAVYVVRVWREIDTREKMNLPFRYAANEDNGNQRFISILLRAINEDSVTAFSGDDDRFTTPITPEEAMNAFGGGFDTSKVYDEEGNVTGYQVRPKATDPDSIYKFRLKEEWIFDKESSRLTCRIIGIAPVIPYKLSTGDIVPNSERPVWWVYYPDLRHVLTKYDIYNPKNMGARMNWEELFETRMFSSYIVKSTVDNPFDIDLAQKYPNNTLFRLLDGDKVKDQIFNYEQSLWSY